MRSVFLLVPPDRNPVPGFLYGFAALIRRIHRIGLLAAVVLTCSFGSVMASAPLPPRAERILSPGRNSASDDSAEALSLNPANLGFLPGVELRWVGLGCHAADQKVGCGHTFDLASPLLWGLSTGLRVDYVQPPASVGFPFNGDDYTWITWGLGWKLSDAWALGTSVARSYSTNAYTDSLVGISASISFRPNTHAAFAVVAHDFNGPSTMKTLPHDLPILDPSYVASIALRPTGRRGLELGLDLRYLQGSDQFLPRATLGIDIPGVGRARGDVEIAHLPNDERRGVVGTAGLEIGFGNFTAGGGVLFGSGLGSPSSIGEYGTLSVAAYREPGVPRPARAVFIRLESTPDARGHVALLRKLWKIADGSEIKAVALVLRTEPASSFAHAEEIADAIRVLRARGKKVLCSLEDNASRSLYVCANADRTVVNPAGGIRYAGLKSQYVYFGGLLKKLGVRAEFVRIGEHKTAPEQYMNEGGSDIGRADHRDLFDQSEAVFVRNLAVGRKLTEERVREETKRGPFVASEARDAGFVDGFAYDDELERVTRDLVGREVSFEKYESDAVAPDTFGPRAKVALLYVEGDMIDGRSQHIPLIDLHLAGSYSLAQTIRDIKDNSSIKSVVLRIESPGGSSMAADVMWRELVLLAEKKPLIVSMGSVAASGGYYIASPARTIYALPLTTTGSIGIFYGKADFSGLLSKIGVNVETYKSSPRADAESLFRPFTDDERQALKRKIEQFYDVFLDRVAQGRHLTKADVDAVGQGRVWTGQQAIERHLVDKLGGLRDALDAARAAGHLPYDAPIVEYPSVPTRLIDKVLELAGFENKTESFGQAIPPSLRQAAKAIAPFAFHEGEIPMARLEWVPLDE